MRLVLIEESRGVRDSARSAGWMDRCDSTTGAQREITSGRLSAFHMFTPSFRSFATTALYINVSSAQLTVSC